MIEWNKVTWYSKLGAIIFFLAILPVLCFYIGIQYEEANNAYIPFSSTTQVSMPAREIINDGRNVASSTTISKLDLTHSFSVSPTSDFILTSNLTPAQKDSKGSYMDVCMLANNPSYDPKDKVLCYVGNEKSDGFVGAAFVIDATSSITQEDCARPELDGSDGQTTTTVNGITFYKNKLGDAGLGHYLSFDSYRTYHNNACYTLDLKIESDRGVAEKGLSADFTAMMLKKMESILSTFRFVN